MWPHDVLSPAQPLTRGAGFDAVDPEMKQTSEPSGRKFGPTIHQDPRDPIIVPAAGMHTSEPGDRRESRLHMWQMINCIQLNDSPRA